MKIKHVEHENGSILMMALITITILIMICAVSLHITTQNANATTQTTSWQQAMAGAESAVDQAMKALNTNDWTGWYPVTAGSLPTQQPSPTGTPFPSGYSTKPGANQYYYYSSSFALQGEASNTVNMWVMVDNGSISPASSNMTYNGNAYRIRATGIVGAPGPARATNNKLDNDLRKISLRWDRFATSGSGTISTPQAVRRIELVAKPVVTSTGWPRGITLQNWLSISGSATVYSDIGLADSSNADFRNQYVYGSVQFSGPAIHNTHNVQGDLSTPFNPGVTSPVNPNTISWATTNNLQQYTTSERAAMPLFVSGNYTQYSGGGSLPKDAGGHTVTSFTANGPSTNPTYLKVNGDFTVGGGSNFNILSGNGSSSPRYVIIWVTGKLTLSGGSSITQVANTYVTYIVDNDITVSGASYNNQGSSALNFEIVGVGNHHATISSSSTFMGAINAPNYDATVSGSGNFTGAILADTLTLSGSGQFAFDTHLGGTNTVANYSYASWFEDNSDPARGITY